LALAAISSRRRRSALASDARAGRYSRWRYRRETRSYLREYWPSLARASWPPFLAVGAAAAVARDPLVRGLLVGAGVTATASAIMMWIVLDSGVGPRYMGEVAEQRTAAELRRIKGARLVNHFGLDGGDVDHLLVGAAGVFVVETKWSASDWKRGRIDVRRLETARVEAVGVAKKLALWEPYKRLGLPAPHAVVALWGPGAEELTAQLGTSDVVAGSQLRSRLEGFGMLVRTLTPDQIDAVWRVLSDHLVGRDREERAARPMPPSIAGLGARVLVGTLAGLVGFLGAAGGTSLPLPLWAWAIAVCATACAAAPVRHWARLRIAVSGLWAGLAVALSLAAVSAGGQLLR